MRRLLKKSQNYAENGKIMCENAKKTLSLIKSLSGPWTPEQQATFALLESSFNTYCNNKDGGSNDGSGGGAGFEDKPKIDIEEASKKACMTATAGVIVYVIGKKVIGGIMILIPEPVTTGTGAALVLTP